MLIKLIQGKNHFRLMMKNYFFKNYKNKCNKINIFCVAVIAPVKLQKYITIVKIMATIQMILF